MKKINILKTVLITLIIVAVSIISFLGIYVQDKNIMSNLVPDYLVGRDLKGYRRIEIEVNKDTETIKYDEEGNIISDEESDKTVASTVEKKTNEDEVLTVENYNKSKKIIENRLEKMKVVDYVISLNKENGKISVDVPEEDSVIDSVVYELMHQGKFEIVDEDTGELLLNNDNLKAVKAGYGTNSDGATSIFINFQFDKEGTKKFEDITSTYVKTVIEKEETEEKSEEADSKETESEEDETSSEDKTETITKNVVIKVDGDDLLSTYFDQPVKNGVLQLSFGSNKNLSNEEMQDRLTQASNMAILLNNGKTPIVYELTQNRFVNSDITGNQIDIVIKALAIVLVLAIIYLIVRYKLRGFKGGISLVGFAALLLIAIRIFNVEMSINGIFAVVISTIFSFILIHSIVDNKNAFWEVIRKYSLILAPSGIIGVVFTLMNIPGGAVLFWGILINVLYNITITKWLLDDENNI